MQKSPEKPKPPVLARFFRYIASQFIPFEPTELSEAGKMKELIALTGLVVLTLLMATSGHISLGLYFAVGLTLLLGLLEPLAAN